MSAARYLFLDEKLPSAHRIAQEDANTMLASVISKTPTPATGWPGRWRGYPGDSAPGPAGSKGCPATTLGLRGAGEWVTSPVGIHSTYITFNYLLTTCFSTLSRNWLACPLAGCGRWEKGIFSSVKVWLALAPTAKIWTSRNRTWKWWKISAPQESSTGVGVRLLKVFLGLFWLWGWKGKDVARTRAGLFSGVQGWRVRTAGAMAGAVDYVLGPDLVMVT